MKINVNGVEETWDLLRVVDFTSERKRMSVVVRRQSDGRLVSFVKGADISIEPRIAANEKANAERPIQSMDDFAC